MKEGLKFKMRKKSLIKLSFTLIILSGMIFSLFYFISTGISIKVDIPGPKLIAYDSVVLNGVWSKKVTVYSNEDEIYYNVPVSIDITENLVDVELHRYLTLGLMKKISDDPAYDFKVMDTNGNGLSDRVSWVVPELSEVSFSVEGKITETIPEITTTTSTTTTIMTTTQTGVITTSTPFEELLETTTVAEEQEYEPTKILNPDEWEQEVEKSGSKASVDSSYKVGLFWIKKMSTASIEKDDIEVKFEDFKEEDADWNRVVEVTEDVDREKLNEFLYRNSVSLKDFVWIEPNGFLQEGEYKGEIILPSTYKTVFVCEGTEENPDCFVIQECGETPCFEIDNGKTVISLNHFSGAGGADLTIINVQSYPTLNGNWTVSFNTTGTANLTITAVDGTQFDGDLEFLELKCGDNILTTELIDGMIFVENYYCDEIGYETSRVVTPFKHTLKFVFGDDVEYAYNQVSLFTFYDTFEDGSAFANFTQNPGPEWVNSNEADCDAAEGTCQFGTYCACIENGDPDYLELTNSIDLSSGYVDCWLYWWERIDNDFDANKDYWYVDVWTSGDTWQNIITNDTGDDTWRERSYNITAGVGLLDDFQFRFGATNGNNEIVLLDEINITCWYMPPWYSNNVTSYPNGTVYDPNKNYGFQINWTDDIGFNAATFWTDLNFTGGANFTTTNDSAGGPDVWYINFTNIGAGTYSYQWFGNDTAGNQNSTNSITYIIEKAASNTSLFLNETENNRSYDSNQAANFTVVLNVSGKTVYLDSNYTGWVIQSDTDSSLENITILTVAGDWWNMTGYFEGDDNYTSSLRTYYFNVSDITSPIYSDNTTSVANGTVYDSSTNYGFQINWTDDIGFNAATFWTDLNFTGGANFTTTNDSAGGPDVWYINFTNIGAGTYSYQWFGNDTAGNQNSTNSITYIIEKAASNISLFINENEGNASITNNTAVNITVVNNVSGTIVSMTTNRTGWSNSSGATPYINTSEMMYSANFYDLINVTGWWGGSDNYTADLQTYYINITPSLKLIVNLSDPYPDTYTEDSPLEVTANTTFWVNATITCQGTPGGTCGLVNGSVRYNVSTDPDTLINTTEGATPLYVVEEPMEKETEGLSSDMDTMSEGSAETQDTQPMSQSPEEYHLCERDMFTNRYCNPSGGKRDTLYLLPQNYWNGTEYTPIDTTIHELPSSHYAYQYGYRYGVDKGIYQAYFKPNMSQGWESSVNISNIAIGFDLQRAGYLDYSDNSYQVLQQANTNNMIYENNELNYTGVFTGIDVQYTYISSGLKENVFLNQTFRDSAPNPSDYGMTPATTYFVLESQVDYKNLNVFVNGTGQTSNFTSNETIEFRDIQGNLRASLPVGYAIDSVGNITKVRMRLVHYDVDADEENEHFLLYGVPVTWLSGAVYPVTIDPTETLLPNITGGAWEGINDLAATTPDYADVAFTDNDYDLINKSDNNRKSTTKGGIATGTEGSAAQKFTFNLSYINRFDIANVTYTHEGSYSTADTTVTDPSIMHEIFWKPLASKWNQDFELQGGETYLTKNFTDNMTSILYYENNFTFGIHANIEDCNPQFDNCAITVKTDFVRLIVTYGPNPPTYSKNTTNTAEAGQPANFSLEWTDDAALHPHGGFIFSTNNSGTWENSSWTSFTVTPQNATNVTILNSTVGVLVQWCFYANDTTNKWNGSSCDNPFNLTTTGLTEPVISVTATSNTTTVTRGDHINVTAQINCLGFQCNFTNATIILPSIFELAAGQTATNELGNLSVGNNYTSWIVKAIHNGSDVINVTVESLNSTGEINDTDSTDTITVTEPENPKSCGVMNQGDSCTIKWLINATGAVNSAYKIDVNFSSSDTGITSNDTENAIVKIVAAAVTPYLEVNLTNPAAGSTTIVDWNTTFNVNATVTCRDTNCGNVNGTIRYNLTSEYPDTPVNSTQGEGPFYNTSGTITQSCGTLNQDDFCQLNWTINATGTPIVEYKIGVLFNSSDGSVADNHTDNATIRIIECIESFTVRWNTINFGTINPNTGNNAATGNSNLTYNISNTGTCNLSIWLKGSDLINTTFRESPETNHTINVGNITWHNTTDDYSGAYTLVKDYVILNSTFVPTMGNITTYYWLTVPPIPAGKYNGTMTYCANTSQQSGGSGSC